MAENWRDEITPHTPDEMAMILLNLADEPTHDALLAALLREKGYDERWVLEPEWLWVVHQSEEDARGTNQPGEDYPVLRVYVPRQQGEDDGEG